MGKIADIFILALAASQTTRADETPWHVSSRALSCPKAVRVAEPFAITLAPGAGQELAVRRVADGAWFFLVVASPPAEHKNLLEPAELSRRTTVEIPANLRWASWSAEATPEVVFRPGEYEFYLSDTLESEIGGYRCHVKVMGLSPNNSSKPTPHRGAA